MSDTIGFSNIESSNSTLYEILKNCVNLESQDNLQFEDYNDVCETSICDYYKMITVNSSQTISSSSFASDESFPEQNILEEDGRISLAYENLRTIPRRIADKFATQTKFLDLSYNNFQNLSFLTFFEELHTLILDQNKRLDVNTLPLLPNLRILWINNCDISNITDWIHRVQMQCPNITQISMMGNSGTKNIINRNILHSEQQQQQQHCMTMESPDYSDYVRQVLPQLEYLDGVALIKNSSNLNRMEYGNNPNNMLSSSSSCGNNLSLNAKSISDQMLRRHRQHYNNKNSINNNHHHHQQQQQHHHHHNNNGSSCSASAGGEGGTGGRGDNKTSPTLSFKDLFRLKRRKKSYQSSSTN